MEGSGSKLDAKQERLVKGGAGQDEKKVPRNCNVERDGSAEAKMMGQRLEQEPSSKDWLVWQLVDSLLPTGGFAHSLGVEVSCHLCASTEFTLSWYFWVFPGLCKTGLCKREWARTKFAMPGGLSCTFCRFLSELKTELLSASAS